MTYDAKGLITSGTDATTADIADSSNRRYVTDAFSTMLTAISGASGILKSNGSGTVTAATAGTDYLTADSTNTLTNKTFDANGTGNSLSNIETADFASNVIDTDTSLAANSNTRIASQAATKSYIDNAVAGLKWKAPVVVATTVAGTLASDFENGDTVDGIVLATGDRILIKNQVDATVNGIYIVAASGAPTRATDADAGSEIAQLAVFVASGTVNADKAFVCTNNSITLGVTSIAFAQFTGGGALTASTGIDISGNSVSTLANQSHVTAVGTLVTGTWNATAVAAAYGGTGQSSYAVGDTLYASGVSALSKLAGNITTTRKFLQQTGDGGASAAPTWDTVTKTDVGLSAVENTALSTWAGTSNITTIGTLVAGLV